MTRMSRALRGARRTGGALSMLLLTMVMACDLDSLLDVESTSRIPAEDLENPDNATLLVNSAIGDFECALGAYTVLGGLIGDELEDGTQTADRYPYDRRNMQQQDLRYGTFGCTALGVYTPLQTARTAAENALRLLNAWTNEQVAGRADLVATASAYAGYSMILLGEGFCEMVVSTTNLDGSINYGGIIEPDSIFELAIDQLENATASTDVSIQNMAYLGLARAHLNLGNYSEARTNAQQVDAGFIRVASASAISARRENKVWAQSNINDNASNVASYYHGLADPRVPVVDKGENNTLGRPIFYQTKYGSSASPLPLATYEEALLIIAEAELEIGDPQIAVGILSDLRVAAGQGTFASTDDAEIRDELIEQRRRELFLEGHHLNDYIRFDLPFRPGEDDGDPYFGSGQYGAQRCLPIPLVERQNNPNIN